MALDPKYGVVLVLAAVERVLATGEATAVAVNRELLSVGVEQKLQTTRGRLSKGVSAGLLEPVPSPHVMEGWTEYLLTERGLGLVSKWRTALAKPHSRTEASGC